MPLQNLLSLSPCLISVSIFLPFLSHLYLHLAASLLSSLTPSNPLPYLHPIPFPPPSPPHLPPPLRLLFSFKYHHIFLPISQLSRHLSVSKWVQMVPLLRHSKRHCQAVQQ